jgi:hypothetical protein
VVILPLYQNIRDFSVVKIQEFTKGKSHLFTSQEKDRRVEFSVEGPVQFFGFE